MIHLLTPEDFVLWKAIRLEAVREHPAAYGGSFDEESLRTDSEWAQLLRESHVFAYLSNDKPVGVAGYFFQNVKKKRHRATIFTVYVKPPHRGKGVTDWLFGAIEYHARDHGIEQMHLDVGITNEHALRLYERLGYTVYATEPRFIKIGEDYIDEYKMVKFL